MNNSVPSEMTTANLAIKLRKLAKSVSYYAPDYRSALLTEAADRLFDYRQIELGRAKAKQ